MKAVQLLLAASMALCAMHASGQGMPMPGGAIATTQVPYVNAEVEEVDAASGLLTLQHEAIPNLNMPGMTMPFPVADPKLLDGLRPGDKVRIKVDQIHGALTVTAVERGK